MTFQKTRGNVTNSGRWGHFLTSFLKAVGLRQDPRAFLLVSKLYHLQEPVLVDNICQWSPNPVGMKSYVCALAEGIMLDFELYQGADALIAGTKWTGFGRFGHWSSVWNSPSWYKCVLLSVLYIHQSCEANVGEAGVADWYSYEESGFRSSAEATKWQNNE